MRQRNLQIAVLTLLTAVSCQRPKPEPATVSPIAFSDHPVFVADSKRIQVFSVMLAGDIKSAVLSTDQLLVGQFLAWLYQQDMVGGHKVKHPENLAGACDVNPAPSSVTYITAIWDGMRAVSTGCTHFSDPEWNELQEMKRRGEEISR